jgi:hypothetical protein
VKSRGSADGQILATCDCNLDLVSFILLDGASGLSCVLPSRSSDQLEGMTLPGEADGQPAISYITEIANTCVLPADLCERVECPEASSDCKVAGECDSATGQCAAETDAPDLAACDDMDATTAQDSCSSGVCMGVDLCADVTCTASSDCKVAGECAAMTGQCTDETDAPDGIDCDDGDMMTNSDVCTAGVCQGAEPPPAPPATSHAAPSCDGQVGIAVHIVTSALYSDEIQWDIDGGTQFPTAGTTYEDSQEYYEDLCLPAGTHTIHYFDSVRICLPIYPPACLPACLPGS